MDFQIISELKKISKLARKYTDSSNENKICFQAYSNLCSEMITEAKEIHINKMRKKLDDAKASTKSYWSIVNGFLTLLRWRLISYRNQSIYLQKKSMDWFLYDIGLRLERVK